jgi:hypothetical protein
MTQAKCSFELYRPHEFSGDLAKFICIAEELFAQPIKIQAQIINGASTATTTTD